MLILKSYIYVRKFNVIFIIFNSCIILLLQMIVEEKNPNLENIFRIFYKIKS